MSISACAIVIPCYNEEHRLPSSEFSKFIGETDVQFIFVDDGSTDRTASVLDGLAAEYPSRVAVHRMVQNRGKAEAVREGLLKACAARANYVGFWDADLATPLEAILDFRELLDRRRDIEMVFGARINLLGRAVNRRLVRHYFGRVFATAAAFTLGFEIYDTQCGAKLFRVTDGFAQRLQSPFIGGWIFDVEMIAREVEARRGTSLPPVQSVIYEYPLDVWRDVAGSKISGADWLRVGFNLCRIWLRYLRRWPSIS